MPHDRRQFMRSALATGVLAGMPRGAFAHQAQPTQSDLAQDRLRPQFHLLPTRNWINDPCGPIFFDGKYHVFNQYNPHASVWGDMHWTHAVSEDMVHWRNLPVALAPTPGGPDADGCFTGSAILQDGVPTIIYTGVTKAGPADATLRDGNSNLREVQCLATAADPSLGSWKKAEKPVLPLPPPGMQVMGFRDPCPWRDGDWWYLGVGSGVAKKGGMVLLYRSRDLRRWEYLHPLREGEWKGKAGTNPVDTGEMWECPDFFPLGNQHVLFYSTEGKVIWEVGDYDKKEMRFHPQRTGLLDAGAYYAPKSMLDKDGNRILWGWIPEKRPEPEFAAAGWAGLVSLPRVLTIGADGGLEMRFAPAIEQLRGAAVQVTKANGGREAAVFGDYRGEALFSARPGAAERTSLTLQNAGKVLFTVEYDPGNQAQSLSVGGAPLDFSSVAGEPLKLHLVMDASAVELLVNDRVALTRRIYNLDAANRTTAVGLQTDGNAGHVFKVWEVNRISANRLTT